MGYQSASTMTCKNGRIQTHWLLSSGLSLDELKTTNLASVRLRAAVAIQGCEREGIPATLGESIQADTTILVIGKIGADSIDVRSKTWTSNIIQAKRYGAKVVLDYTDHHLAQPSVMSAFYNNVLHLCDTVIVPSHEMYKNLKSYWRGETKVIPDAIEYKAQPPKESLAGKTNALWFGHPSNLEFLVRFLQRANLENNLKTLMICTDLRGIQWIRGNSQLFGNLSLILVEWSINGLPKLARQCDFALLPTGKLDPRKSGASENRLITALALGLPVVANSLPSYKPYREYYSDIDEDDYLEVVTKPWSRHELVNRAQKELIIKFSTESIGKIWSKFIRGLGNETC